MNELLNAFGANTLNNLAINARLNGMPYFTLRYRNQNIQVPSQYTFDESSSIIKFH